MYACREKEMKVHQHNAGHMTKMAAMPCAGNSKLGFYMGKCDEDGFFGNYCIM